LDYADWINVKPDMIQYPSPRSKAMILRVKKQVREYYLLKEKAVTEIYPMELLFNCSVTSKEA
jgi:hypothetical protein